MGTKQSQRNAKDDRRNKVRRRQIGRGKRAHQRDLLSIITGAGKDITKWLVPPPGWYSGEKAQRRR